MPIDFPRVGRRRKAAATDTPPPPPADPGADPGAETVASSVPTVHRQKDAPLPPPPPGAAASAAASPATAHAAGPERHRFPCHTCGAELRYAPGTAVLHCDHCGAEEPIPGAGSSTRANRELDYASAIADRLDATDVEDVRLLSCPNCGAQVEFDDATHATECPFCATPLVTDTGARRQIKPRGLLPFAIGESDARDAMRKWMGSLWFAPNGLSEYARKGRAMQGIYTPYWTYDADSRSTYTGLRGDAYYVTRTVTDNNGQTRQVTERRIRWTPAAGQVARAFDDVLVLAATSLPKRQAEKLEPWDLEALEDYRPEYLAGFRSEGYTVPLDQGLVEARTIMDRQIDPGRARRHRRRRAADPRNPHPALGRHLQAHPAAGLAGRLPLPRQGLPLRRQRPHRRGPGRTPLLRLEDRRRRDPGPDPGRHCRIFLRQVPRRLLTRHTPPATRAVPPPSSCPKYSRG